MTDMTHNPWWLAWTNIRYQYNTHRLMQQHRVRRWWAFPTESEMRALWGDR